MSSDLDPDLSKNISCSLSIQAHLPSTCNIVHSAATFMFSSSLSLGHPFRFVFLTDSVVFIAFVTLSPPQTPPPKHYFRLEILVAVSRETLFVLILPFRRHGEIQWKKQSSNSFLRRLVACRRVTHLRRHFLCRIIQQIQLFYFRKHGSPYRFP